MPISDAQFTQWLKDAGDRRVLLAEIDFVYQVIVDADTGTPTIGTVYLGDYPLVTEPGDTPANRRYRCHIAALPGFLQSIDTNTLGGQTRYTVGRLELINTDAQLDSLVNLVVDGQECRLYLGDPNWARSDYRNVMTAIVQQISAPTQDRISVALRDRGLLLNASVVGATVGGVGPNAGRPLQIICGYCNNVEAILIDSIYLTYGIADTAARPVHVYDSAYELEKQLPLFYDLGAEFEVDTVENTILHVDLNLAIDDVIAITTGASMGLVSGDMYYVVFTNPDRSFRVSTIRGGIAVSLTAQFNPTETVYVDRYPWIDNGDTPATITLAHPPFGRVTVDVDVPIATNSRASDIIRHLVVDRGGVPSGNFTGPLASFTEDGAGDYKLGLAITERRNLTDVLDEVLFSVNGFWGFDRLSNFIYGRIRPQGLGALSIALEIASDDIVDIQSLALEHLQTTYKEVKGFFYRSWTDQTDGFAGGVELDRISYLQAGGLFYGSEPIVSTRYEDNPGIYHEKMIASPEYMTLLSQEGCPVAFTEFKAWLEDRRQQVLPNIEVVRLKTNLTAYATKLGDVVNLTLDRFGLDGGARMQVLAIDPDFTNPTGAVIALSLIRRRTADVTTASYP
jgi:hypothetical protein